MTATAIIVAAGIGSRFGDATPKQFIELLGKPLLIHTIERFESCDAIDDIVLVVADDQQELIRSGVTKYGLNKVRAIVAGGATRAESVSNGLGAVNGEMGDIVAVHDGARPLVTADEISRTVESAVRHGAACLVAEVTDTIKEAEGEFITGTVDRSRLRRALTPQAFRYEILRRAYDAADLGSNVTDDCFLVEKLGARIACVEGSARNIKITRPDDLRLAEFFLSERP